MNLAPQALGLFVCWWDHLFFHFVDVGDSLGAPISGPGTLWCYCSHRLTFSSSSFWRKSFLSLFPVWVFTCPVTPMPSRYFTRQEFSLSCTVQSSEVGTNSWVVHRYFFYYSFEALRLAFFFFLSLFVVEESFLI